MGIIKEGMQRTLRKALGLDSMLAVGGKDKSFREEDVQKLLRDIAATQGTLNDLMQQQLQVASERMGMYREFDLMLQSPLVSSALEYYAETVCQYDNMQNSSIWCVSRDTSLQRSVNKLFSRINIEELIYDWVYSTGLYGDLFLKIVGQPGLGVMAVYDSDHPMAVSRLDLNGRLLGFYETPMQGGQHDQEVLPPWTYVHSRLLGVKKRRQANSGLYGEMMVSSANMWIGERERRLTSKYGASLLTNSVQPYKRLRLCEESLMLARLSKGIMRYLYKVKVDSAVPEGFGAILSEYKSVLKRARALNVTPGSESLMEAHNELGVIEDVIVPVWGDTNNLEVEKLGGEADIKWIKDHEEYRNQLGISLRVPYPVLGGYLDEMPSGLGDSSLERYDIRFARSAGRLSRAIKSAVKQLALIHLAYQGRAVKPHDIEIQMAEISSAEDEERKKVLDVSSDIVAKLSDTIIAHTGEDIDKVALLSYLNKKLLKLNDLDLPALINKTASLSDSIKNDSVLRDRLNEAATQAYEESLAEIRESTSLTTADMASMSLPHKNMRSIWESRYGSSSPSKGKVSVVVDTIKK